MKTLFFLLAATIVILPLRAQQVLFGAPTELSVSTGDSLHGRFRENSCMQIDPEHNRFTMHVSLARFSDHMDSVLPADTLPSGDLVIEATLPFNADQLLSMYPEARTYTLNGTATIDGAETPVSFSLSLMAEQGVAENRAYSEQLYPYYSSMFLELPLDKFGNEFSGREARDVLVVQVDNGLINKISQPLI